MIVSIIVPNIERLEACGWEYQGINCRNFIEYSKIINGMKITLELDNREDNLICNEINCYYIEYKWMNSYDIITIGQELKKLEEK